MKKFDDKRRWRFLQIEPSFACNLRCVMCPWKEISKKARNQGLMSQKVWNSIRSYLSDVHSVDFTGGGEPLLQPKLEEWIAEAKSADCETGFLSNGLLLGKEKQQRVLDAGVDWIGISIDGATAEIYENIRKGSHFGRVCENLAGIVALRTGNVPKIMINFVITKFNFHQVQDIVRLAARLGVDQVNFKQCDVIRGKHGKGCGLFSREENREIRRFKKSMGKARRLAQKLKILTTAFLFTPEERPVCEQDPRSSMFICYDGTVAPCINLAIGGLSTFLGKDVMIPSVHYGCLPEEDLMDLWQSEPCKFYRRRFKHRVQKYDETIVNRLLSVSGSNRERTLQIAREAMPEPPDGCNICHYLYDV